MWNGELVPENDNDVVFKTTDKEFLRLKKDGTFLVGGAPVEGNDQVVGALKEWLAGTGGGLVDPNDPVGRVLTITTPKPPSMPPLARAAAAHAALKIALKERDAVKKKAIASLAELLTTFQRLAKPLILDLAETIKCTTTANERLSNMFDYGGKINTVSIDGIFGLELNTALYITYYQGVRTLASPESLAEYLITSHPGFDIEAALNKIGAEVEAISERVVGAVAKLDNVTAISKTADLRLKQEEVAMKALTDGGRPKGALPDGQSGTKALTG